MTILAIHIGPDGADVLAEDGTDLSDRFRKLRGDILYYCEDQPGRSARNNPDLLHLDITDMSLEEAASLFDHDSIDEHGAEFEYYWNMDLTTIPIDQQNQIKDDVRMTATKIEIGSIIINRKTLEAL